MITDPTEKKLKAVLFRRFCPTELELGEFELDLLEKSRRDDIATHVEYCPHCRQDLIQISKAITLPLAQEGQGQRLDQLPVLAERAKIFVIDLLSPPPGVLTPAFPQGAVRGPDSEMETQVIQVGSYLVALSMERDPAQLDKYNLVGDISIMEEIDETSAWQAYLWQDGDLFETVSLQDANDFVFMGVPSSDKPYELIISSPTVEIHLQQLHIPGGVAS
jgi:hypothetical protein